MSVPSIERARWPRRNVGRVRKPHASFPPRFPCGSGRSRPVHSSARGSPGHPRGYSAQGGPPLAPSLPQGPLVQPGSAQLLGAPRGAGEAPATGTDGRLARGQGLGEPGRLRLPGAGGQGHAPARPRRVPGDRPALLRPLRRGPRGDQRARVRPPALHRLGRPVALRRGLRGRAHDQPHHPVRRAAAGGARPAAGGAGQPAGRRGHRPSADGPPGHPRAPLQGASLGLRPGPPRAHHLLRGGAPALVRLPPEALNGRDPDSAVLAVGGEVAVYPRQDLGE
jgi:hypothetical protein